MSKTDTQQANIEAWLRDLPIALGKQLDAVSSANHTGAGHIVADFRENVIRVRLASVDRIACEVESIAIASPAYESLTSGQMQCVAENLATQLSYLEENLIVVETDQLTPEVQLRSETPQQDESGVRSYFELCVGRHGLILQRYEKQPSQSRTTAVAPMTRNVFFRVSTDLAAAMGRIPKHSADNY